MGLLVSIIRWLFWCTVFVVQLAIRGVMVVLTVIAGFAFGFWLGRRPWNDRDS